MPPSETDDRPAFILQQPIYRLTETEPERRWQAVVNEHEPKEEAGKAGNLRPAFTPPKGTNAKEIDYAWQRLTRDELLDHVEASARVLRGGSWSGHGRNCRSANRFRVVPVIRHHFIGFRLAAVPCIVGAK